MKHHTIRFHLALSVLPLFAASLLACGSSDDGDGANPPPFDGNAAGAAGASSTPVMPGDGDPNVVNPGGGGQTSTPGNPNEPSVGDGTPLEPGTGGTGNTPAGGAGGGTGILAPGQSPLVPPFEAGPPNSGAVGGTPNLFAAVLGRGQAEIDQKVQDAVNRFFGIGSNDPTVPSVADGGSRIFYPLPQDPSMAFVYAADSRDIRSEGQSYGMFIAVQMDMQEQFNQLWRFAKTFMQYPSEPVGDLQAWRLYFRWSGTVNSGDANNWVINFPADQSPASDGEEYFAAALYLADRRWGSDGEFDYQSEADQLTHAMLNNPGNPGGRTQLIHPTTNMVTFVPYGTSAEHTDPSYHLPAFYELFAQDGPQVNRDRWLQVAEVSRQFFVTSANAATGLHPDYAQFDGAPTEGFNPPNDRDTFAFDAWRVPMNMAIDHVWTGPDARLEAQIGRYMTFFANRVGNGDVMGSAYTLDGTPTNTYGSQGLTAALAVASQVGNNGQLSTTLLNNLWNASYPTGEYRYYQSSVYVLGMLAASGKYAFGWPQAQ